MYSLLTHTSRYQNNSSARCTIVSTNSHSLSYSILDKMNNIILYNY